MQSPGDNANNNSLLKYELPVQLTPGSLETFYSVGRCRLLLRDMRFGMRSSHFLLAPNPAAPNPSLLLSHGSSAHGSSRAWHAFSNTLNSGQQHTSRAPALPSIPSVQQHQHYHRARRTAKLAATRMADPPPQAFAENIEERELHVEASESYLAVGGGL